MNKQPTNQHTNIGSCSIALAMCSYYAITNHTNIPLLFQTTAGILLLRDEHKPPPQKSVQPDILFRPFQVYSASTCNIRFCAHPGPYANAFTFLPSFHPSFLSLSSGLTSFLSYLPPVTPYILPFFSPGISDSNTGTRTVGKREQSDRSLPALFVGKTKLSL